MANFTRPLNFIRSTLSRAGKFIESPGAQRAMATRNKMISEMYAPGNKLSMGRLAAGAGIQMGGAAYGAHRGGKGHRISGAVKGFAGASLALEAAPFAVTQTGRSAISGMARRAGGYMRGKTPTKIYHDAENWAGKTVNR